MAATAKLAASTTIACAFAVTMLTGCTQFDVFISAASGEGTVYKCSTRDGRTVEVCYFDDADEELGELLGGACGDPSGGWKAVSNVINLGCAYSCEAPRVGCNAHNGCYCP